MKRERKSAARKPAKKANPKPPVLVPAVVPVVETPVRTREMIVTDALMSMAEGISIRKLAIKEKMPFSTLLSWLTVPELADQYARAREAQAMWWVEQALAVASGTDDDQFELAEAMVKSIADADENDKDRLLDKLLAGTIQRDRLHTDTLKWAASKFHPRQFGDKLDLTSKGDKLGIEALVAGSFGRESPAGE